LRSRSQPAGALAKAGPFQWLLVKEWRELWSARAWWLMLLVTGPLVGMSFINAIQIYAELSGYHGTAEGVGEAFSPLVGVWSPTFSAYELVAAFLFPFVVIRLVAGDRHSGALKIELQQGLRPSARIAAKAIVLAAAWLVAMTPLVFAILLWMRYGGVTYAPEILTVALGHLLNAFLTIAIGAAAASVAEHPATAAIIALSITVGTWVVNFFGAIRGGWWEQAAAFTPPAMVAQFQHGLIRLDIVLSALVLAALGLGISAIWMRLGEPFSHRVALTAAAAGVAGVLIACATFARPSWDASENRQNSFSETEETALRSITQPLSIEAHFAPADGRRAELERTAVAKLRRIMPNVKITYVSQTSVGMFEQNTEHYGEIIYTLNGKQAVSRIVTAEGVLETIFDLAGVTPAAENENEIFRGHPLAVPPRNASVIFYGVWPAIVAGGALVRHRRTA
jgi:ABC-2 type transport system permease protein